MARSVSAGARKVIARLTKYRDDLRHRVERAAYIEAGLIMSDSKQNYVPVDFGILKGSGQVHPPEWQGDVLVVQLSYGGAAKAYALAVHEHLSKHSPWTWRVAKRVTFHPAGRGPKYLEKPLKKASKGIMQRIAARINKGL